MCVCVCVCVCVCEHSESDTIQDTETLAVRKSDKIVCPRDVYILVVRERK